MRKLIVMVSLLAFAVSVSAAPALQGSWTTVATTATVDSLTHGTWTGTGDIIVVAVSMENAGAWFPDAIILGTRGVGTISLTKIVEENASASAFVQLWWGDSTDVADRVSDSLYFDWTGTPSNFRVVIGVAVFSGIDQSASPEWTDRDSVLRTGTTPNPLVTPALTVAVDDLVIGVASEGEPRTHTYDGGFTTAYQIPVAADFVGSAGFKIITSAGTQTVSVTTTGSPKKRESLVGVVFNGFTAAGGDLSPRRRRMLSGG